MKKINIFFVGIFLVLLPFRLFGQQDSTSLMDFGATKIDFVPAKYKLLYKVGWSKEDIQNMRDSLQIKYITMKRSGCYGNCPVYNLKFRLNGTAQYHGIRYVDKKGKYSGKISLWDYGKLCYFLDRIKFKKLNSKYRTGSTDLPSVTVSVHFKDGTQKKVYDYGGHGPIEFWGLTQIIDSIKNDITWKVSNVHLTSASNERRSCFAKTCFIFQTIRLT